MMPAITPTPTPGDLAPLRILVADDNAVLRMAVGGLIRNLGHSVEVASDGREAVERAGVGDFDLVLLDIQMPVMGGFEAASSLRLVLAGHSPTRPCPRIIGFSGDVEDERHCLAAGMDGFLAKPLRLADLARALQPITPSQP